MQPLVAILNKKTESRTEEDLAALVPLIREISFFKEKNLKEKDLYFICQKLKYEMHPIGTEVLTYGNNSPAILSQATTVRSSTSYLMVRWQCKYRTH